MIYCGSVRTPQSAVFRAARQIPATNVTVHRIRCRCKESFVNGHCRRMSGSCDKVGMNTEFLAVRIGKQSLLQRGKIANAVVVVGS